MAAEGAANQQRNAELRAHVAELHDATRGEMLAAAATTQGLTSRLKELAETVEKLVETQHSTVEQLKQIHSSVTKV
jgi:hypothetical protein